jgi:hypothetical protein
MAGMSEDYFKFEILAVRLLQAERASQREIHRELVFMGRTFQPVGSVCVLQQI